MNAARRALLLALAATGAAVVAWALAWALRSQPAPAVTAELSVAAALSSSDTTGYARAYEPRPFRFPQDHGPHPAFRNEWWYFTGNLSGTPVAAGETGATDGTGRRRPARRDFGFQLTFFRNRLAPLAAPVEGTAPVAGTASLEGTASVEGTAPVDDANPASDWRSGEVYMAHFALSDLAPATATAGDHSLSDPAAGRFFSFERFRRPAIGLAGATLQPLAVWLEDWSATAVARPGAVPPGAGGEAITSPAWRLRAAANREGGEGNARLDVTVDPVKPLVLQGEAGLSRKSAEPGNASYYYSFTRMAAAGTVEVDGVAYAVAGNAWMDREWSTSALAPEQVGWDWFSLQLDDGRELMLYRLRLADGGIDPASDGVLVERDGRRRALAPSEVELTVTDRWTSADGGATYPAGWRLRLPNEDLELEIQPRLADQELRHTFRYWEGAVALSGRQGDANLGGVGYVELTGY